MCCLCTIFSQSLLTKPKRIGSKCNIAHPQLPATSIQHMCFCILFYFFFYFLSLMTAIDCVVGLAAIQLSDHGAVCF